MTSLAVEVSVVIAAYDAEATLADQLAALSRQKVSFGFEVLVCDNGSTDGTVALAESWADRLPVRVVDASARRGPGAARNAGAAIAAGMWLAFCDADDVVADDWLFEMHSALQTADFVAGTSRKPLRNARPGEPQSQSFSTYRMPFFPQLPAAGTSNVGVRRRAFESVGGFDESLRAGEDVDLCWRMQLAGHRLTGAPDAIVDIRIRNDLRSEYRQAYHYGVGDRRLRHKFAKVIPVFHGLEPLPVSFDGPTEGASPEHARHRGVVGRIERKIAHLRRAARPAVFVPRLGTRLGATFGSVDRALPQIAAPERPEMVGR